MRIGAMLRRSVGISCLRSARAQVEEGASATWLIQPYSSWNAIAQDAGTAEFDVAVIESDFPNVDEHRRLAEAQIPLYREWLEEACGGSLVVYTTREMFCHSGVGHLHRLHHQFVIVQGLSDDPISVLRILSRATSLRRLRMHSVNHEPLSTLVQDEASRLALVGWPPSRSMEGLAKRLHTSPRTLRRRMHDRGALPPKRMLAWGQLLEAHGLSRMGFRSRDRLSKALGKADSSFLTRLCRTLTGRSAQQILDKFTEEDLLDELAARLREA